jgi:hypothetical protein
MCLQEERPAMRWAETRRARRGRRTARRLIGAALTLSGVLGVPAAPAQPALPFILDREFCRVPATQRRVAVVPIVQSPELNGALTEECWTHCVAYAIESDMPEGVPSRATSVRVCRDDKYLYVGFECHEPAIAQVPLVEQPLKGVWSEQSPQENVQVWISTSPPEKDFFLFAVDPNGSRYHRSMREGIQWSPKWNVKTSRTPDGWDAELAIPAASLGVRGFSEGASWRVNFCRDVAATGERCSWEGTMGNRANPAAWGTLFFGERAAYDRQTVAPQLRLYVLDPVVGAPDKTLRAVVHIEPGSGDLSQTQLRVSLEANDAAQAESLPSPAVFAVEAERVSLILNVAGLPPGDFSLHAELMDKEGAVLGRAEAAVKKRALPENLHRAGKLDVLVEPVPVKAKAAASWPMTAGVALPMGAIYSADNARLLGADGREIPCRAQVRARWPSDGSIRWLGLHFNANIARKGGERDTLEYGPQVSAGPVRGFTRNIEGMRSDAVADAWVTDTGDGWWVNTGALYFDVNYKHFSGIENAWVDVRGNGHYGSEGQILNAEMGGFGPYLTDSYGTVYRLGNDPKLRMELEEYDELRLVLRVEGRLLSSDRPGASDLGRCVVRIVAYLGQPFLRVQCCFIFNERTWRSRPSDIAVAEHMDFHSGFDAVFGTPEVFRRQIEETGAVYLQKLRPGTVLLQNLKQPPTVDLRPARARNWAGGIANDRGVAVVLRDMDELYPKEIELTPESHLIIHFWPPHGAETLRSSKVDINRRTVGDLDFATSGSLLDLNVPSAYTSGLEDRDGLFDFDAVRTMDISDPIGIALTYDMLYIFVKGSFDAAEVGEIARAFELCPCAVQDAQSLAASGVLQEMLSPSRAECAATMLARLLAMEARSPAEGDFNFMDVRRRWLPDEQRWGLRNYWMGANEDLQGALWLLYLQTRQSQVFITAERNLRHALGMDLCNGSSPSLVTLADPRRRKIAGAFGDSKTPVHWQSTCSVSDRHARVLGPLLAYYLSGDLVARDAALLWAEAAKNYGPPASGADGMAYLDNLMELLSLRYDPVLVERAGDCADYLFGMPPDLQEAGQWIPGLRAHLRPTGDGRTVAYLRELGTRLKAAPAQDSRSIGLLRDLYAATGNADFLGQASGLIEGLEKLARSRLPGAEEGPGFGWDDFCAYVFGAAEPLAPPRSDGTPAK